MKEIVADEALIATRELYCGACGAYLREHCPGCTENVGFTWCKARSCCLENGRATCAASPTHANPKDCAFFHNVIARIFVFRSDRPQCIARIRQIGDGA